MHYSKLSALLSLVLTSSLTLVSSVPLKDDSYEVTSKKNGPVPSVAGRLFKIDGVKQYFSGETNHITVFRINTHCLPIGVNAWWLGHLYDYADVDQAFSQISSVRASHRPAQQSQLKFCSLGSKPSVYGPSAIPMTQRQRPMSITRHSTRLGHSSTMILPEASQDSTTPCRRPRR